MSAALTWIVGDDTGVSSKTIWSHMMTGKCSDRGYPHDADDFGRCERLLALVPEWRPRLIEMAKYGSEWAQLALHWDELASLHGEWWAHRSLHWQDKVKLGAWQRLYDRLNALYDEVRVCGNCGKKGLRSWSIRDGQRVCYVECAS